MEDYRKVLRINLAARMKAGGYTIKRPPVAYYLSGKKRGHRVSARTIQYMLSPDDEAPSPSLDTIAAVALAFKLQPWQLLAPGYNPDAIEAEVSRRVAERMEAVQKQLSAALQGRDEDSVGLGSGSGVGRKAPGPRKDEGSR